MNKGIKPPFVVGRPNSTVGKRKRKSNQPSAITKKKTIIKKELQKNKEDSRTELVVRVDNIEKQLDLLENKTAELVSHLLEKESNKTANTNYSISSGELSGLFKTAIEPKYPMHSNASEEVSQFFKTAINPDDQTSVDNQLIDAVNKGNYLLTKKLVEDYNANINIRDADEQSLLVIAYTNIVANQNPEENRKIINYLQSNSKLDPEIRKEYTEFFKRYNKRANKRGGKSRNCTFKIPRK